MAGVETRYTVGGFVTKSRRCSATNAWHISHMRRVLGYAEQYRGVCENCGMPLSVQGAAWVSEIFTIVEELDLLDELRC